MALFEYVGGPSPRPARPLMEAQQMELRDRFRRYHEGESPMPGDFVREKRGLGIIKNEVIADAALILWRFLDPDNALDREIMLEAVRRNVPAPDCFIALLSADGSGVELAAHHTALLERIPGGEFRP